MVVGQGPNCDCSAKGKKKLFRDEISRPFCNEYIYAPRGKNKRKRNKRILYKNNKEGIWDKGRLVTELYVLLQCLITLHVIRKSGLFLGEKQAT
jgi:hypothetical protein